MSELTHRIEEAGAEQERAIQWCWVVWAMKPGDLQLAAICTTSVIANRYRRDLREVYPDHRLTVERAPMDHTFGASDLRSVAFRASMREHRQEPSE